MHVVELLWCKLGNVRFDLLSNQTIVNVTFIRINLSLYSSQCLLRLLDGGGCVIGCFRLMEASHITARGTTLCSSL